jgi:hypothetical protein
MQIDADSRVHERTSNKFRCLVWRVLMYTFSFMLILGPAMKASAQDLIPAGTLLQCTLSEPNFSSATVDVGDPVVCYLKSLQEFGHIVLPRGSYLQGHLSAEKDPGHFWGKGYLKLEFDRIGLPNTDIPVPSKVVAASDGYKSNREGELMGKGHATRDVIEWMLPPLWPWKMISLPARGPRPKLKGEELLTLRLMDDVVVPKVADGRPALMPGWHRFGESNEQNPQIRSNSYNSTPQSSAPMGRQVPPEAGTLQKQKTTLIALKSNQVLEVTRYRIEDGRLSYVLAAGATGSADVSDVDWTKTSEINIAHATLVASVSVP